MRLHSLRCLVTLALAWVAFASAGELPSAQRLPPGVTPVRPQEDPGPTNFIGTGAGKFDSADFEIDGGEKYRVYFDYADARDFHFLERRGPRLFLGLSEAGVEQLLGSGSTDGPAPLRIARRGSHLGVFQKGKLLFSAFDDLRRGGRAGFRILDEATGRDAGPTMTGQPRDELHFSDDFMISEEKSAQWRGNGSAQAGDFTVKSLRNPGLSTNAFNYMGAGSRIYSVVGQPWWEHYCYRVSARGPARGALGLIFAFQDEKNYGLFRWSSRQESGSDLMPANTRELVRVREGHEVVLARAAGGYAPNQWYKVAVTLSYAGVNVSVDGHSFFDSADRCLLAGGAGVWCDVPLPTAADAPLRYAENSLQALLKQHAVFDDVRVDSCEGVQDDFRAPGPMIGGWLVGLGAWNIESRGDKEGEPGELVVTPGEVVAKALIGDRRWAQYEVQVDVVPGATSAGLVFLHRDESSYYYATADREALRLMRVQDGKETVVDMAAGPNADRPVRLKAAVKQGHVRVTANERESVEMFDTENVLRGRVGLIVLPAKREAVARFSRFRLAFLAEPEPLVTDNAIFDAEDTMSRWNKPATDWHLPVPGARADGKLVTLLWHRAQFPGDVELMLEPREITAPNYELALSVSKNGQGKDNGYVFRYKPGSRMELWRQGVEITGKPLEADLSVPSSIALRRCGRYVIGLVNGKPAITYRDEHPLNGGGLAYYTRDIAVRNEGTRITSGNFRNEIFSHAPACWRTAGFAVAEVTNRWQCDPRWSFFSLKNDRAAGKPAVLWNKALYPGDVSIEFFVANKMEAERGEPYTYARDINVSICSDGADLAKGYTFMFGGKGNTGSMILRNGVEVKTSRNGVPTIKHTPEINYHRHWFWVKVEKRGNRLSFRVDSLFNDQDKNELVFEDKEPLAGNRIAIWTYDHAIMLSRVRISGDGGDEFENPDFVPPALKTPYDEELNIQAR